MYIFWWGMFFNNSLYVTFTWCTSQFLLLNTFYFLFPQTFLLINSIFLCFDPWIFCQLLIVSKFLTVSCAFVDVVNVVTVNKLKQMACYMPHASQITTQGTNFRQTFFSVTSELYPILVTHFTCRKVGK